MSRILNTIRRTNVTNGIPPRRNPTLKSMVSTSLRSMSLSGIPLSYEAAIDTVNPAQPHTDTWKIVFTL